MNGDNKYIGEMDGDHISDVVNKLERVSAPSNFECNVMRAIRLRADEPSSSFAWLKIAIPTAALLLLAAFFGLSSLSTRDMPDIRVAGNEEKLADPLAPSGLDGSSRDIASGQNGIPNRDKDQTARRTNSDNGSGNGSIDQAVKPADDPTLEKGFEANKGTSRPLPKSSVSVLDILQFFGVRSENRGGEYVVTSVVDASASAKVGLEPGDVLIAINDIAITPTAKVPGGTIQSMRVRRNGQNMTLRF